MKAFLTSILFCVIVIVNGQRKESSNWGIGSNFGYKTPYGGWGLFYFQKLNILKKNIEINGGAGINESLVLGLGTKLRIYNRINFLETHISINYSHQAKGNMRYETENGPTDYYKTSSIQKMHYYLTNRFFIDKDKSIALQLNTGYAHNASGYKLIHTAGPNLHYQKAEKLLKSGLLIGIDIVFFFGNFNNTIGLDNE